MKESSDKRKYFRKYLITKYEASAMCEEESWFQNVFSRNGARGGEALPEPCFGVFPIKQIIVLIAYTLTVEYQDEIKPLHLTN